MEKDNKSWNSDEMFLKRYNALTYAQKEMTGEAFDNAERWLKANEDRYIKLITQQHFDNNIYSFIQKGI